MCSKTQFFSAPLLQIWTASAASVKLQLTIETSRRWCDVGCDGHWLKVFFWVDVLFGKAVGSPDYLLFILLCSFRSVSFRFLLLYSSCIDKRSYRLFVCITSADIISSSFLASVPARSSSIKIAWAATHYAYLFWQWGQNLMLLHFSFIRQRFHEIFLFFSYCLIIWWKFRKCLVKFEGCKNLGATIFKGFEPIEVTLRGHSNNYCFVK